MSFDVIDAQLILPVAIDKAGCHVAKVHSRSTEAADALGLIREGTEELHVCLPVGAMVVAKACHQE